MTHAPHDTVAAGLSSRQREFLAAFGDGLTHKEVGARLGVTERTAKAFADLLTTKFAVARTRDLVPIAKEVL